MNRHTQSARRNFFKLCAAAGLGVAVPVDLRLASGGDVDDSETAYEGPYYVVFNASGGWDTTYLMDPKGDEKINRLYREGDIVSLGAHRIAPTAGRFESGMSNEDFFARYGDELLTVNGLDYSVNNHSPCSRYMATGKLDSLAYPTFAALVAACLGSDCPLAFLTFGNYSATGNLVPMARIPYLRSLNLIANADAVSGVAKHPYHDSFVGGHIERALEKQLEMGVSQNPLPRVEQARSTLYSAQLSSRSLRRVVPFIPEKSPDSRLGQQSDIALAAFKAGVCVSANLSIGQFDSHSNNDPDQMKLIPEFLGGIDYLIRRAEELQIREKLVIVIQSEMGRTPWYNNGNGKDHWSIGSAMFMGAGIRGNRVVGATDEGQFLVPIDAKSLQTTDENGVRMRPEHLHLALRRLAGIADHPFSRQFPLSVADEEILHGLWTG